MKFTIQISAEDYIYANKLNTRKLFLIFTSLFSFYAIIVLLLHSGAGSSLVAIFFIVMVAYYLVWYFVLMPSRTRTIYEQQKKLHIPFEFEVSESGFTITQGENRTTSVWSEILRWRNDDKMILIYPSDAIFILLPQKSFANKSDFDTLKEILNKSGVSKKKKIDWRTWRYGMIFFVLICILSAIAGYFNLFG